MSKKSKASEFEIKARVRAEAENEILRAQVAALRQIHAEDAAAAPPAPAPPKSGAELAAEQHAARVSVLRDIREAHNSTSGALRAFSAMKNADALLELAEIERREKGAA